MAAPSAAAPDREHAPADLAGIEGATTDAGGVVSIPITPATIPEVGRPVTPRAQLGAILRRAGIGYEPEVAVEAYIREELLVGLPRAPADHREAGARLARIIQRAEDIAELGEEEVRRRDQEDRAPVPGLEDDPIWGACEDDEPEDVGSVRAAAEAIHRAGLLPAVARLISEAEARMRAADPLAMLMESARAGCMLGRRPASQSQSAPRARAPGPRPVRRRGSRRTTGGGSRGDPDDGESEPADDLAPGSGRPSQRGRA